MQKTISKKNYLIDAFHKQVDESELLTHIEEAQNLQKSYVSYSFSIKSIDVLAALEQVKTSFDFQYYWEKPSDDFSISAGGALFRLVNSGESRFRDSSTQGKELLSKVHHLKGIKHQNSEVFLFGGFSFFQESNSIVWKEFESASFTLPEWMIIKEGECTILTLTLKLDLQRDTNFVCDQLYQLMESLEPICNVDKYREIESSDSDTSIIVQEKSDFEHLHWIETVNRAKSSIEKNEFDKVVLARELVLKLNDSVSETHVLHTLRQQYPDCYCFLIRHSSNASFIGCTPERLAAFQRNFILTEGLAGSAPRGKNATEDAIFENNLLSSEKDRHEHRIVLEAIHQQLTPFSKKIQHPKNPSVKKLSNVQHLKTPITAAIDESVSRTEVLKNLHPTPAVGGYPRSEAVKFIQRHEDFDRGWYAAPIGWINTSGTGEFAVAIRSGLFMRNEVRFFAGCGIVQDSDPQKEWDETNMKFIPMLTALKYAGS